MRHQLLHHQGQHLQQLVTRSLRVRQGNQNQPSRICESLLLAHPLPGANRSEQRNNNAKQQVARLPRKMQISFSQEKCEGHKERKRQGRSGNQGKRWKHVHRNLRNFSRIRPGLTKDNGINPPPLHSSQFLPKTSNFFERYAKLTFAEIVFSPQIICQ